jgi:hypothetical protein
MWSNNEFSTGLDSFHKMNRESLVRAAYLIGQNAGQSFSRSLGNSFRQTVAGILAKENMTPEKMLEGTTNATVDRCKQAKGQRIIVAQDTTIYNYSGHKKMKGLGKIQGSVKGILQHNALAIDEAGGIPLGMIYQHNWTREGANEYEVESDKWFKGLQAVNDHLGDLDKTVVVVQDREADIFDFFKAPRARNVELVVRVCQRRKLEVLPEQQVADLYTAIEQLPLLGTCQASIRRANREVHLTLSVQAGAVNVLPKKDLSRKLHKTKGLSVVVAREIAAVDSNGKDCFDPQDTACWILLTSLEVSTLEQACQVVYYYSLRWLVERLHYTLKSGGLEVERLQFDDVLTTFNALALYTIIAWRILFLTLAVRQDPEQDPQNYFTPLERKVLRSKMPQADMSLAHAIKALGKLVNFVPTTAQPFPGLKVMAQALRKLNDITEALKDIYEDPLQD